MASRRSAQQFIALVGVMVAVGVAQARTTRYVDDDAPGDPCPGDPTCSDPLEDGSVAYPFDAMQECIDVSLDGDLCIVGDGSYTGPGNHTLSFGGRAITLRALEGLGACTMDCEGSNRGVLFVNGESEETVVDGLIFHHGSAIDGAGMFISNGSSPTIVNCMFQGNIAARGGAMHISDGSNPAITDCLFIGNAVTGTSANLTGFGGGIYSANSNPKINGCMFIQNAAVGGPVGLTGRGGGIYCLNAVQSMTITNCVFSENQAVGTVPFTGLGGGIRFENASATLTDCKFIGNAANGPLNSSIGYGGAMSCANNSNPTVTGSVFASNHASWSSGGMFNGYGSSPVVTDSTFVGNTAGNNSGAMAIFVNANPTITSCRFLGNASGGVGGAMIVAANSSPEVTNCLFTGNTAATKGGAVWCSPLNNQGFADPLLTNCTFSANTAGVSGGGIFSTELLGGQATPMLRNSVVWGNAPDQILDAFGAVTTATHSNVQGSWPGANNIDRDPLFIGGPTGTWTSSGGYDANTGQSMFTDMSAMYLDGALVGKLLNPDTSQALQSLIVANTQTTVTVWGDFSQFGTMGVGYRVHDYRLSLDSPVINAADNAALPADASDLDEDGDTAEPIPVDLDGDPRFMDVESVTATGNGTAPIVDMGPFEAPEALARAVSSRFLAVVPGIHLLGDTAIKVTSTDFPCMDLYVTSDGSLAVAPVFQHSDAWGTAYIRGEVIRPGSTYEIRIEDKATISDAFKATTWRFGDVNNDGVANFEDLLLMSIEFQEDTYAYAADLAECTPDGVVNMTDILWGVLAFQGGDQADMCGPPCP